MALSDSDRERNKKRPTKALTETTNKRWSDNQKLEAVKTYLVIGNLALTARMLGIPEVTLRIWKATNWWKEVVDDLKQQERVELSNKLKRIVEAAHSVVENRLVNGDPIVVPKTGEIVMKPVTMRDAHRVAVDLLNQKEMVDKTTNPVDKSVEADTDRLKHLAEQFAEFATKAISNKQKQTNLVFVEDITPKERHELAQNDSLSHSVLSSNA